MAVPDEGGNQRPSERSSEVISSNASVRASMAVPDEGGNQRYSVVINGAQSSSTALSRHHRYLMTVAINGVQSSSTAFSGNPRQSSEPRDDCEMMTVPSAAAAR